MGIATKKSMFTVDKHTDGPVRHPGRRGDIRVGYHRRDGQNLSNLPFRMYQTHLLATSNSTLGPPPQPSSISTTGQMTWMSNHMDTRAISQSML